MNHCVRLLLLFTPSLVALGLLGIAFTTDWWTFSLEQVKICLDFIRMNSVNFRTFQRKILWTNLMMKLFIQH